MRDSAASIAMADGAFWRTFPHFVHRSIELTDGIEPHEHWVEPPLGMGTDVFDHTQRR